MQSIVEAFVAGAVATVAGTTVAWLSPAPSLLDGLGLAVSTLWILSASFVLFALVNLSQTSLKVRMIGHLLENPDGLSPAELLRLHPETDLIEVRIRTIKEAGWVRVVDSRLYPKVSVISTAATGMSLLKWVLYARRRGPHRGSGAFKDEAAATGSCNRHCWLTLYHEALAGW